MCMFVSFIFMAHRQKCYLLVTYNMIAAKWIADPIVFPPPTSSLYLKNLVSVMIIVVVLICALHYTFSQAANLSSAAAQPS